MKGASSNSQLIADTVVQWSYENRVKLNSEKCKELRISFAKNKPQLAPIVVNNQELECVESAKLLREKLSDFGVKQILYRVDIVLYVHPKNSLRSHLRAMALEHLQRQQFSFTKTNEYLSVSKNPQVFTSNLKD